VRQVGHLLELYEDARSEKYKIQTYARQAHDVRQAHKHKQ